MKIVMKIERIISQGWLSNCTIRMRAWTAVQHWVARVKPKLTFRFVDVMKYPLYWSSIMLAEEVGYLVVVCRKSLAAVSASVFYSNFHAQALCRSRQSHPYLVALLPIDDQQSAQTFDLLPLSLLCTLYRALFANKSQVIRYDYSADHE